MPTPSGHTRAIAASRVSGSNVYNPAGEKIGEINDVVLDKMSNEIMFSVIGFGGFLGIGERYHAVPWSMLDYDRELGGYRVNITRDELERAPSYDLDDLLKDDGTRQASAHDYFGAASTPSAARPFSAQI